MRHRLTALTIVLALALGLTACASPTGTGSAPGSKATTSTASGEATSSAMSGSNPDAGALLSIADVEDASGLADIKIIEADSSTQAIGRLNFATREGTLIATMNIGDGTAFDQSMQGMLFSRESTGTGSMCFVGPSEQVSPVLTVFAAAKGDHAVIMKTFTKTKGGTETWLTIDQLQVLAGLVLSRWQ